MTLFASYIMIMIVKPIRSQKMFTISAVSKWGAENKRLHVSGEFEGVDGGR